jgi:hypothetical protein
MNSGEIRAEHKYKSSYACHWVTIEVNGQFKSSIEHITDEEAETICSLINQDYKKAVEKEMELMLNSPYEKLVSDSLDYEQGYNHGIEKTLTELQSRLKKMEGVNG